MLAIIFLLQGNAYAKSSLIQPAPMSLTPGLILIATDDVVDEDFSQTVIMLTHYSADGAVGVILNKPIYDSHIPLNYYDYDNKILSMLNYVGDGGPVYKLKWSALIYTGKILQQDLIAAKLYYIADLQLSAGLKDIPRDALVNLYNGIVSWGKGQLEYEIERNIWFPLKQNYNVLFYISPEHLRDHLVRKK
ncbi:hypothetical protein MNBD_GAMMA16-331 [hydrothermal vent metagenome]|uniref:YqgE/AlgH family protein n=1 Tax=hydrothermal vent metagenome TaxID=652676 RepID=A0A3B0ZV60_9ZZZZ